MACLVDPELVFVQNQTYASDAALVLSCSRREVLAERVRTAVELLTEGEVALLILSGDGRKGDERRPSEARRMRNLAIEFGATADQLVMEERSQTTIGNAKECRRLIASCPKLSKLRSFKVVTSAWNSLRAEIIFRNHFPPILDLHSHPSSYGITRDNWQESQEGLKLVRKEVRLIGELVTNGYRIPRRPDQA